MFLKGLDVRKVILILLLVSSLFSANKLITLNCVFDRAIVNEEFKKNLDFRLKYIVDMENNTAIVAGNNGSSEVLFLKGQYGGISLIEITGGNYVMTTTIDPNLKAVHSRHSIIKELFPQQYYGKCEIK
jgi:hypothetical protein